MCSDGFKYVCGAWVEDLELQEDLRVYLLGHPGFGVVLRGRGFGSV